MRRHRHQGITILFVGCTLFVAQPRDATGQQPFVLPYENGNGLHPGTLATSVELSAERQWTSAVDRIGAQSAYDRGVTGRGVVVGVIDTGVRGTHLEFSGRIRAGLDVTSPVRAPGTTDIAGHGSHVAGLVAGKRDGVGMHGIAYGATILPVQVFSRYGNGLGASDASVASGIRYAIGRAPIVNLSLGANVALPETGAALQAGVRAGTLYTIAAGNQGLRDPSWPARYAREAWANGQIIAVGAVDANNRIASFSNRAGDARNAFLVAPGTGLISAYNRADNVYASMSGTSMAAPVVAGAAALVKSRWMYLTAQQTAGVLFRTATDLGAPGVDEIYGWGLVNVERAMQPVGALGIQTANGRIVSVANVGTAAFGTATGAGASSVLRGASVAAVDETNRDFQVNVGGAVQSRPAPLAIEQVFGTSDRAIAYSERVLDRNGSKFVAAIDAPNATGTAGMFLGYENRAKPDNAMLGAAAVKKFDDGSEAAFGTGGMNLFFGLAGTDLPGAPPLAMQGLSNPVMTLVPYASSAGAARSIGGLKVKFGFASAAVAGALAGQQGLQAMSAAERSATIAMLEVSRRFGADLEVGLGVGALTERGAHLGSVGTGLFALNGSTRTTTWSTHAAWRIADGLALAGHYTIAVTSGALGDGLIAQVSAVRSDAFGLGLVQSDVVRAGDRLSVSASQPLRATAGDMTIVAPAGMNGAGEMQFVTTTGSVAASGRELLTELNYSTPVGKSDALGVSVVRRRHPGNDVTQPAEHAVGVRYQRTF